VVHKTSIHLVYVVIDIGLSIWWKTTEGMGEAGIRNVKRGAHIFGVKIKGWCKSRP
jgi:hypothetical protein